jgi:hypothetical protein
MSAVRAEAASRYFHVGIALNSGPWQITEAGAVARPSRPGAVLEIDLSLSVKQTLIGPFHSCRLVLKAHETTFCQTRNSRHILRRAICNDSIMLPSVE